MTTEQFEILNSKLDRLERGQDNLSRHVEELGVAMGAMNDRLTAVEKAVNRVATEVGVEQVPADEPGEGVPHLGERS